MKITHTRTNVVQYNEYYPFGLQTANSWTRENTTGNNFLGNGGTELNTTSNLYDLDYRNYDPILGRMNGVDPMAPKYASLSPYNFSFNDPVTYNDPSGADPPQTINYGARNSGWFTSYTYDDRVDYYRGEWFHGGSSSAMSFHFGGRSGGLRSTISSWNPNFYGPVYLGKDLYNNPINVLPSEIQRAGSVQACLSDYHKSHYSTTIDFGSLPDHSQTTLFFWNGAVVDIIQRAINVNNIEALKKIAESIGIGDLDDVIASHDKVLDFVFKTLTDLGNFSITKQDLESMEFDLSTHEILDGISKISKLGNQIFIERSKSYSSIFDVDLGNHKFELGIEINDFIGIKYYLGDGYIFGDVTGFSIGGEPVHRVRTDGLGFGFYWQDSWVGR